MLPQVRKLKPILTSTRQRLQRATEVFHESYVSISEQATTFANAAAIIQDPSNVTATMSDSDDGEDGDGDTPQQKYQKVDGASVRDVDALMTAAASLDDEAGVEIFHSADINGDGRINKAEFQGLVAAAVRAAGPAVGNNNNTEGAAQSHSPGLRVTKQIPAQRFVGVFCSVAPRC